MRTSSFAVFAAAAPPPAVDALADLMRTDDARAVVSEGADAPLLRRGHLRRVGIDGDRMTLR